MVVLFRLLLALLKSRFRRRLGILDECVIAMRVWPNDLDLNMHMNSGRYLSMMDVGRMEILARTRMLREVLRRGWRPMVGATVLARRGEIAAHAYVRGLLRGREGNVRPYQLLALAGKPMLISPPMPDALAAWRDIVERG
jgi:hypothetical protein